MVEWAAIFAVTYAQWLRTKRLSDYSRKLQAFLNIERENVMLGKSEKNKQVINVAVFLQPSGQMRRRYDGG